MAQPVNAFDSHDVRGIREDLSDIIHDVSPSETPFYSMTKKTKASATYTEWQTDGLRASADNAHIEGDDTVAEARTATTRLGNYTQIFKNAVNIPDTDEGLNKAGRGKEMAYQVMKVAKEQKLDIEKALFANQARSAGSSLTPRRLAGAPAWLVTNTINETGSSGADPTGDGTNARTDDGVPVAFSQTRFDLAMQTAWNNGGKPDTVYLSSFQMNIALGFTGNNNQRNTVSKTEVSKNVEVYVTPWGKVEFYPTRQNRTRDVFIMQSDMWAIPVLRGTKNTELAKTGDSEKRQVVTELSLACSNEKAHAAVYDNTTS
jgi:hypothetical protein